MLIRFGVQNHRSIRDAQEISFARSALAGPDHVTVPAHGTKRGVLPVMALYGANASGKSNVLDALRTMVDHIVHSHVSLRPGQPMPYQPFRLDETSAKAPTRFDVDVQVDGVHHHYGFAITAAGVDEEWLYAWPEGHRQLWFHRVGADPADWKLGPKLTGPKAQIARFTRENSLFLSAAAQNNHPQLEPLYRYFEQKFKFEPSTPRVHRMVSDEALLFDPEVLPIVVRLLRSADLGIVDARIQDRSQELDHELRSVRAHGFPDVASWFETNIGLAGKREIELAHRNAAGGATWLAPHEESAGTLAFLRHLFTVLPVLAEGGIWVIDELQDSLHPNLAKAIVEILAYRPPNAPTSQLLFTTHDQNLLDALRRDEVVVVDKAADGATTLTPVSDFKTRSRDHLRAAYAEGRYGGVPRLTGFARAVQAER